MIKRLIGVLLFLLVLTVPLHIALWQPISNKVTGKIDTSWTILLLGPGDHPRTCAARFQPSFIEAEPALTELAETLLNNPNVDVITNCPTCLLMADGSAMPLGEPTDEMSQTNRFDLWQRIPNAYGMPQSVFQGPPPAFEKSGGLAAANDNNWIYRCGYSTPRWIGALMGLTAGTDHDVDDIEAEARFFQNFQTDDQYVYFPDGVPDNLTCDDPWKHPDEDNEHLLRCEIKMTEKWIYFVFKLQTDIEEERQRAREQIESFQESW